MKTTLQRHAILLAALLQVLPIVRNFIANPAAGSAFAFILRWGVGTAATLGAYDACSGASGTYMNTSSNVVGTVGVFMNFTNNFVINGGNTASTSDGFTLSSAGGTINSPFVSNGQTTTVTMPPGLTFKCFSLNNATNIYGVISGTPAAPAKTNVTMSAVYTGGGYVFSTNVLITINASSASAPVITNNPSSLTNLVAANVTFSVTNGGTAPFQYQWYYNTNTALPGATNASVTLSNIQLANSGYYRVAITNTAGSTNSLNALLTVWQPPVITNQPAGVTNVAGGGASFTVTAGGVPALSYQWKYNASTTLSGATASTFNLAGLRASQAGNYTVIITNSAGSITSAPAALVVTNPLPPPLAPPVFSTGQFQFSFNPVVGLTNTVLTNGNLTSGNWGVWTNIPPPANNNPITIGSPADQPNLFYQVMVQP